MVSATRKRSKRNPKLDHGPDLTIPLSTLSPATVNSRVYRPIAADDPQVRALADDIARRGQLEPIVITRDWVIVSGHRRYSALKLLGLTHAKCRIEPIDSDDPEFLARLVAYNRQRVKTNSELLREEIILADQNESYEALIEHRKRQARITVEPIAIGQRRRRDKISGAKGEFLTAAQSVVERLRSYWPLSVRQIHYQLLNDPPLKHSGKAKSRYVNDEASYKALVNLLTRARYEGSIPFEAIHDPTRPVTSWGVHRSPADFIRSELADFLKNYWRDLLQSQPNHIELFAEKNTVQTVLRQVAAKYTMPMTIGRGYCSQPPLKAMVNRYRQSGKEKLIILFVTDCDPEGQNIGPAVAKTIRDDMGITKVHPIKVALTRAQVEEMNLPPLAVAKSGSSRTKRFTAEHGQHVWELEAIPPERLVKIVTNAIDSVLDIKAFNAELNAEKRDSAFLAGVRQRAADALSGIGDDGGDE